MLFDFSEGISYAYNVDISWKRKNKRKEDTFMKELRVLVACGGGIATSTFAANEIAKIAKENHVPIQITKSPLQNVPAIAKDYDILFTTSKYSRDVGKEVVQVNGLITGIGEEEVIELIAAKLKELSKE